MKTEITKEELVQWAETWTYKKNKMTKEELIQWAEHWTDKTVFEKFIKG